MSRSILSAALLLVSLSAPGIVLATTTGTLTPPYNEGRDVDASAPLHGVLRDNGSMRATALMTVISVLAVFAIPLYVGLFSERLARRLAPIARQPSLPARTVIPPAKTDRPRRRAA